MLVELMYFLLGTVAVIGTLMLLTLAFVVFFDFLSILLKSAFENYHDCKKAYLGPTVEKPKVLPPPPPVEWYKSGDPWRNFTAEESNKMLEEMENK